jgi:hypothetical protein
VGLAQPSFRCHEFQKRLQVQLEVGGESGRSSTRIFFIFIIPIHASLREVRKHIICGYVDFSPQAPALRIMWSENAWWLGGPVSTVSNSNADAVRRTLRNNKNWLHFFTPSGLMAGVGHRTLCIRSVTSRQKTRYLSQFIRNVQRAFGITQLNGYIYDLMTEVILADTMLHYLRYWYILSLRLGLYTQLDYLTVTPSTITKSECAFCDDHLRYYWDPVIIETHVDVTLIQFCSTHSISVMLSGFIRCLHRRSQDLQRGVVLSKIPDFHGQPWDIVYHYWSLAPIIPPNNRMHNNKKGLSVHYTRAKSIIEMKWHSSSDTP